MTYRRKEVTYEAIQYTGDLQALRNFGITRFTLEEFKDKHIGIFLKDGKDAACPVGDYIIKNSLGELEIVSALQFEDKFSPVLPDTERALVLLLKNATLTGNDKKLGEELISNLEKKNV